MSTAKDNVGYPYEIDMGYKIDRQDIARASGQMPADFVIHDADHPDVQKALYGGQENRSIQEWNEIHGKTHPWPKSDHYTDASTELPLRSNADPWVNGRYALAALVWAMILMLVVSLTISSAHASGAAKKKDHPGTKVQAIEQRDSDPKKNCLGLVRVVGSQWNSESGAEESAQKAWAEHVRFNYGEAYMDWNNALMYQKRCSRSSIGEALGQTLNRCEIEAAPCRPPFTAGVKP